MLRIIAVGKMKDKRLAGLVSDFLDRCRPLAQVEVLQVKDSDPDREGRDMVQKLGSAAGRGQVVALDENGKTMTSKQFSSLLGRHGDISFLIGGPDGLGNAARERATTTLRLSSMTLTHELARVLLAEQIYRGLSILRGLPYHR